jgi:uncharacterized delta-60 repeat protein
VIAGGSNAGFAVARFRPNGRLDRSFGNGGTAQIDLPGYASAIVIRPDARIVVVGDVDAGVNSELGVAQLNRNGSPDQSFGDHGTAVLDLFPTGDVEPTLKAALQRGRIVVSGDGGSGDIPGADGFVARLKSGGKLDPSFANDGIKVVKAPERRAVELTDVAIDSRRRIAVATSQGILRLTPSGAYDHSFSGDGWRLIPVPRRALLTIAVLPGDRLVAGGHVDPNMILVRVKSSGEFDHSFAKDGIKVTHLGVGDRIFDTFAEAVLPQRDGKLVVGISVDHASGGLFPGVARFTRRGRLDHSFAGKGVQLPAFRGEVFDAAMQSNGKILLTAVHRDKALVARFKNNGHPFVE